MSASDNIARQELNDRFGRAVIDHPDVMAECKLSSNRVRFLLGMTNFFDVQACHLCGYITSPPLISSSSTRRSSCRGHLDFVPNCQP